ncbi:MAG: hypothetical protein FWH27_01210 [Planctomycetaceae bacterium]|nr:hypothetical protein [Planctomycetaceae bacterium]
MALKKTLFPHLDTDHNPGYQGHRDHRKTETQNIIQPFHVRQCKCRLDTFPQKKQTEDSINPHASRIDAMTAFAVIRRIPVKNFASDRRRVTCPQNIQRAECYRKLHQLTNLLSFNGIGKTCRKQKRTQHDPTYHEKQQTDNCVQHKVGSCRFQVNTRPNGIHIKQFHLSVPCAVHTRRRVTRITTLCDLQFAI